MEIRIRNHSGLNGRGYFYLIRSMRSWQWTLSNFHCWLLSSPFCKGWSLLFALVLWLQEKRPRPLLASTLAKPFLDNSSHIIMEHFDRKVGFASTVSFSCSSMGGVGVLSFLPVEFLLWIFFRSGSLTLRFVSSLGISVTRSAESSHTGPNPSGLNPFPVLTTYPCSVPQGPGELITVRLRVSSKGWNQVSRCSVSESNIIMWPFAMPTQIDGWWAPRR